MMAGAPDMAQTPFTAQQKGRSVSTPQYEATQHLALIQPDAQDQHSQFARSSTPAGASVAVWTAAFSIVPAAFWATIAWFVWGMLAAAVVTIVVLVGFVLILGLLRSAGEIELPEAAPAQPAITLAA
jgi:Flp pilus assembly protein TadB